MSSSAVAYIALVFFSLTSLAMVYATSEDKCGFYKIQFDTDEHTGKRLINHGIFNATLAHPMLCFKKCTENCLCESLNVCGKRCELSSSTRQSSPSDYKSEAECTYYDMASVSRSEYPQIQETCSGGSPHTFCCRTHNPCLNGGECIGFCPGHGTRFQCKCKNGFGGARCESWPYTCQDFLTSPKPANGMYTVLKKNNKTHEVFCDFHSEEGVAWTLFSSRDGHQGAGPFWKWFSSWNAKKATIDWAKYRLGKPDTLHLSDKSTHWRMTCEYDKMKAVDYVDYLRSKISVTNPMKYDHRSLTTPEEECRMVEYVNIRGRQCTDCSVIMGQGIDCALYVREPRNSNYGCNFNSSNFLSDCPTGSTKEFYFNCFSAGCNSGKHRCNKVKESTTQFWFGG